MNAASVAELKEYYDKYEVVSEKTIHIDGIEARTTISVIDNGSGEYKGKAASFVSGELYYRASFSAKTDTYQLYEPIWDAIFSSFTLQGDLLR